MSFSSNVKNELMTVVPAPVHCRLTGAAVLFRALFTLRENTEDGTIAAEPSDADSPLTARFFTLLRKTTNINGVPDLQDPELLLPFCMQAGITDKKGRLLKDRERIPDELLKRPCCRKSFLREHFLSGGSVSDPKRDYHLEFHCTGREEAEQVREVLLSFGPEARIRERKNDIGVYIKGVEEISDVLNLMGAPASFMELENSRILKEMRSSINRRVNCETANIEKTVSAAGKQIADILFLKEKEALDPLPEHLRETADLRLSMPDASLAEIGQAMVPPVGKSGINHRLRRLSEIADTLRKAQGPE